MARFIQDPETHKLIPAEEYHRRQSNDAPLIQGDIEPFQSPIDGTLITTRSQLRAHHAQHGTTDARDYSADWYKRKADERSAVMRGETAEQKRSRIESLQREFSKRGL